MSLFQPALGNNQLANVYNRFQGDRKKVLCVCSAGLLRSTSIAAYLSKEKGYNVRNCGTSQEYALIPISEALLMWADEIHVVEEQYDYVLKCLEQLEDKMYDLPLVVSLDIPDVYEAFNPELMRIIGDFYESEYEGVD